jgi:uncharacterized protein involved in outer membrane biogenesis
LRVALICVGGLVAVLAALVVLVPLALDWSGLRTQIAATVRATTGLELAIDGDLRIGLLPDIALHAERVRASGSSDATAFEVRVDELVAKLRPWPLLRGEIDVEMVVLVAPAIEIDIAASGDRGAPTEHKPGAEPASTAPTSTLANLRISDARIRQGRVVVRGGDGSPPLRFEDIALTVALAAPAAPLQIHGTTTFNGTSIEFDGSVDNLAAALSDGLVVSQLDIRTSSATASLSGKLRGNAASPADLRYDVRVTSLPGLAQLLGRSPDAVADAGPIRMVGTFSTHNAGTIGLHGTLTGTDLDLAIVGEVDLSRPVPSVTAEITGRGIDLDRYLAPSTATDSTVPTATRLDPTFLNALRGTLHLAIDRLVADGTRLGPIDMVAEADGQSLSLDLRELGIAGGNATGSLSLGGGNGGDVVLAADISAMSVDLARLTAAGDAIDGVVDFEMRAKSRGKDLATLMTGLDGSATANAAKLRVGGTVVERATFRLSARPGADAAMDLQGNADVSGDEVRIEAVLPELTQLLDTGLHDIQIAVMSLPGTVRYEGRFGWQPAVGFDGAVSGDAPSLQRLTSWLGTPFGPVHGAVHARAVLRGSAEKIDIASATVNAPGISATGSGSIVPAGDAAAVRLKIDAGMVDLRPYRALLSPREAADGRRGATKRGSRDELDLSALGGIASEIALTAKRIRLPQLDLGDLDARVERKNRMLNVTVATVSLAGGEAEGGIVVGRKDGKAAIDARIHVANIDLASLATGFGVESAGIGGSISGSIDVHALGATSNEVVDGLRGSLTLRGQHLSALSIPFDGHGELRVDASPARTVLKLGVSPGDKADSTSLSLLSLEATGPKPASLLSDAPQAVLATARLGDIWIDMKGKISPSAFRNAAEVDVAINGPSLADVNRLIAVGVPALGPFSTQFRLTRSNQETIRISGLTLMLGGTDATGEMTLDLAGKRPRLEASLASSVVSLDDFRDKLAPKAPSKPDDEFVVPDLPLRFRVPDGFDAKVGLTAQTLRLADKIAFDDLRATVVLDSGRLEVAPFAAKLFGGRSNARLGIDTTTAKPTLTSAFTLDEFDTALAMEALFGSKGMDAKGTLRAKLSGTGATTRALASSLLGQVDISSGSGTLDNETIGFAALGAGDILSPLFGSRSANELVCIGASYEIADGVMSNHAGLMHTGAFTIVWSGTLDFASEAIDYRVDTRSHKIGSAVNVVPPFKVGGTLLRPTFTPNVAGGIGDGLRTALNILRPLSVLKNLSEANEGNCKAAIRQVVEDK